MMRTVLIISGFMILYSAADNTAWAQEAASRCRRIAMAVDAGSRNYYDLAGLAQCTQHTAATATAIRKSTSERDTLYLRYLRHPAAVRSPVIIRAAIDVAEDHDATLESRISAELILLQQVGQNLGLIISTGWSDLLSDTGEQPCRIGIHMGQPEPVSEVWEPQDHHTFPRLGR